ncbi:MAG: hypothetical protein LLH30_19410 [Candidatus Manganitrophus sp. SA1]|nr:hypothetical protein [Candidatus Manganitrophus morganii]
MNESGMEQMMMDGMMMYCMAALTFFALIVAVTLIIQTVLQFKILREVRKLQQKHTPIEDAGESSK